MDITDVLFMIAITFVCAEITAFLFDKIGIPGLVGEMIVGIVFTYFLIGNVTIAEHLKIFITYNTSNGDNFYHIIEAMAELGVIFLLFSVGLKTHIKDMISIGKTAFIVASFGVLIPFILGYTYIVFFQDGNIYHALFMGASMVATSVGVTACVIKNLHLTNTKEARIIIGASVIDDVLGMIILAIVCGMAKLGKADVINLLLIIFCAFTFIIIIVLLAYFVVPWIQKNIQKYNSTKFNTFAFGIAFCLVLAWISETIHLAAIVGAFLAGVMLSGYAATWKLNEKMEPINNFLLPFFFINVGLKVNISGINDHIAITIIVVIILAIIGKYTGCFIGTKISDKSIDKESANIVGIGMIPRGEVGIIVASVGLSIKTADSSAISQELYTVVVLMSVITTIIAPSLLSIALKKKYRDNMKLEEEPA